MKVFVIGLKYYTLRIISFFLLLFPAVMLAQSVEQIQKARQLNQKAETAYRQKDFQRALHLLFQAQKAFPKTQLLFNIARCYEQLKDLKMAYKYYYQYLLSQPPDQRLIKNTLEKIALKLPPESRFIVIQTTPARAKIRIADLEFRSPVFEWFPAGTYPISIILKGYTEISRTIRILQVQTAQIFQFGLSAEGKEKLGLLQKMTEKTPTAPFSPPKKRATQILPLVLSGGGLLLTLVGIGLYSLGLNKGEYANSLDPTRFKTQADFENAVNQNYDSGKNWAIAGYVLCGVGITSLVTGFILYAVQQGYFKKGRKR